jgi:hypothetical protein
VFANSAAHFDALRTHLDHGAVMLVVRVLHKPAAGKWRGFYHYEDSELTPAGRKSERVPKDFAFVVEEIYDAAPALRAVS